MRASMRERDGVVILDMKGTVQGGGDAEAIQGLVKGLIEEGKVNVLVNLSKIRWINSPGIGILMGAYTSLIKAGGRFKLENISDRIRNILTITQLLLIFEVYSDEDEAVASFNAEHSKT